MATVNGVDVVLEFSTDSGTTWKFLVCETESGFNAKTETASEQTKCDGGTTVTALGAKSWSMSGAGSVKVSPAATEVSYGDLLSWWNNGTALMGRIADSVNSAFTHKGSVWITELDLKLPVNGSANFTISLTGNGSVTIV